MREIKFRVWDNFNNRMIQNDRILKISLQKAIIYQRLVVYANRNIENHTEIREYDKQYCNDFELMQYTNVKDVNDTEIYENDIVETTWWNDKEEKYKRVGTVVMKNRMSLIEFPNENAKYDGQSLYHAVDVKVVGNIYENKELLENE